MKALWPATLHVYDQTSNVDACFFNGWNSPTGALPSSMPNARASHKRSLSCLSNVAKHEQQQNWQLSLFSLPIDGSRPWPQGNLGLCVPASSHGRM